MAALVKPEWIVEWQRRPRSNVDEATVAATIDSLRAGATLDETLDLTGLTREVAFKIVGQVGSRCSQIAKKHTKAATILAGAPGAAPTVVDIGGGKVDMVAAHGWVRPRREGEIKKAYAATFLAEAHVVDTAIGRYAETLEATLPVQYVHFADLHAASRGVLPALHLVVVPGPASDAYLSAWNLVDSAVGVAINAVRVLLNNPTPQATVAALKRSYWLVPNAVAINRRAQVVLNATTPTARQEAELRLRGELTQLRHLAQRQPGRLAPKRLEQITPTQMRAIAAEYGHRPGDGLTARTETVFENFAAAAREALAAQAAHDLAINPEASSGKRTLATL